jgi:hypothetical protein
MGAISHQIEFQTQQFSPILSDTTAPKQPTLEPSECSTECSTTTNTAYPKVWINQW